MAEDALAELEAAADADVMPAPAGAMKPSILIGYGDFGKEVLQRLLASTAPRGILHWGRAAQARGGAGEQRLRDIAMLWLPGRERAGTADDLAQRLRDAGTKADFITDLQRQIQLVDSSPGAAEQALGDTATAAVEWLLLPENAAGRGSSAGLDIMLVAHIDKKERVGELDKLIRGLLRRLVRDKPGWAAAQTSDRKLNCIAVLDFDNFRRPDQEGTSMRAALRRSMVYWKSELDAKRPALDRCWLVDGSARDDHRSVKSRLDEVTLFLELLLFAGLRNDEQLRELYQQVGQDQQIAAAFGLRAVERSPLLLSRIAAARFGVGWLPYLRGDPAAGLSRPARKLEAALKPLRAAILPKQAPAATAGAAGALDADELATGGDALDRQWRADTDGLAAELLGLRDYDTEGWAEQAEQRFASGARSIELALQRAGLERIRSLRARYLQDGGQALADALTADLNDSMEPVPLADVLATVKAAIAALEEQASGGGAVGQVGAGLARARAAHRDYLAARDEWIAGYGRGLDAFWPLLALLAALGAAPFAGDLLRLLPWLAGAGTEWQERLQTAVDWIDRPLFLAALLFALAWGSLRLLVHPHLVHGIRRARGFFVDPARGRLRDAILADCAALHALLEQAETNVRATLAADLLRTLRRIRRRLRDRDREMDWLRVQLREFLRMQGVHPDEVHPDRDAIQPPPNSAHQLIVARDDLRRIMSKKPADPERFRARQRDLLEQPFGAWQQRYADAFLDLFGFVRKLSRFYRRQAESGDGAGERERRVRQAALKRLAEQPGFALAFRVPVDRSESAAETFCVLPQTWRDQAARDQLGKIGVEDTRLRSGADPARAYLLQRHLNIAPEALEAGE